MKKIIRFLGVIVIIGVVLYGVYFFALSPNGYADKELLVTDFISELSKDDACENYFNEETISVCETFQTSLDGKEVSIKESTNTAGDLEVVLDVDGIEIPFTFTFYGYEPSGLRDFITDEYYLIDTIR